jgi:uridine phosphorylase
VVQQIGDDALMTSSPGRATSPLLEHDPAPRAFIEPSEQVRRRDVPEACVVTFFGDVVDRLIESRGARVLADNRWEDGTHPLLEVEHELGRLAVLHSGVGAPLAGGLLEQVVAMGCRAFVVCGGAGALRPDLTVGHLVVVSSSLRDEGTSHHYLPAGRHIDADLGARTVLEQVLAERDVPFVSGRTWTTDAPYRETPAKIAARQAEACLTVEMEAAALAAVARFRRVPLAQVVYCGDDLSGETWDHRSWQTRSDVREHLFDLAAIAALRLADHARETEVRR